MKVTAFAAVHTAAITGNLALPSLQRGEANTQQQGQLSGTSTSGNPLIHALQSLLAGAGEVSRPRPLPRRPGSFLLPTAVPLLLPGSSPPGAALA